MREEDVPESLLGMKGHDFGDPAHTPAAPAADRRVAIISTAALIHRGDRPFGLGASDYRIIDHDDPRDLLMTHISANFDRSGFVQDHEVVFPKTRLAEAAADGTIGSVAKYHYTFMGATPPQKMQDAALDVARALIDEGTNTALLVPV